MKDIVLVFGFWGGLIGGLFYLGEVKHAKYKDSTYEKCEKIKDIKGCTSDWGGSRTCSYITESNTIVSGNINGSDTICWRVNK